MFCCVKVSPLPLLYLIPLLWFKVKINDIIGRTDLLSVSKKYKNLILERNIDLDGILNTRTKKGLPLQSEMKIRFSNYRREKTLDEKIIDEIRQDIVMQGHAIIEQKIFNTDRAMGARLSGDISYLFGSENFKGKIQCKLTGTAGQSFGASFELFVGATCPAPRELPHVPVADLLARTLHGRLSHVTIAVGVAAGVGPGIG